MPPPPPPPPRRRACVRACSVGPVIRVAIPYCKREIPIAVVFRALGVDNDLAILQHICYDFSDTQMMELLRPSLEDGYDEQGRWTFDCGWVGSSSRSRQCGADHCHPFCVLLLSIPPSFSLPLSLSLSPLFCCLPLLSFSSPILSRRVALDYIGKSGAVPGVGEPGALGRYLM